MCDRPAVDRVRAAHGLRRDADGPRRRAGTPEACGRRDARPMMQHHRPGLAYSPIGADALAPTRLPPEAAGVFQLPLRPPAEFVVPVEPAELRAGRLDGEAGPPLRFARVRSADRLPLSCLNRSSPASAIVGIRQIIDTHSLPRWLEPTAAGWRPPMRAGVRKRTHVWRRHGRVLREGGMAATNSVGGMPHRGERVYDRGSGRNYDPTPWYRCGRKA